MTKSLFVFDLDGVLIDSKEIHFNSLNKALENISNEYIISKKEQEDIFDGLPTKIKLQKLTEIKGLPESYYDQIFEEKQKLSITFFKNLTIDNELIEIFTYLKNNGKRIVVASNCVSETVKQCLISLGIMKYIDLCLSNESVVSPKPHPEIYWRSMIRYKALPSETYIFEDSRIGRLAAITSGAELIPIDSRKDLTLNLIKSLVEK